MLEIILIIVLLIDVIANIAVFVKLKKHTKKHNTITFTAENVRFGNAEDILDDDLK